MPFSKEPSLATRPRILIAEDDALSASLFRQLLEEEYQCHTVPNGREAWEASQQQNFNLFLLDVMMPEMDGLELCRRLRKQERTASSPIIMVTARTQTEDIVAGLEAGANDYVVKPVDPPVLMARVHTLLRMDKLQRQRQEITSMLTHDLKNSLNLILGAASILNQQVQSQRLTPEVAGKFFDTVRSNIERMTSMINNHLTLVKLEGERFPFRPVEFNPQRLVDQIFDDAFVMARTKGIEVFAESENLPDRILADQETLTRALSNLVFNAIKFTPERGKVSIAFRGENGNFSCVISDTGPGIPEDMLPRIFNRYERSAAAGGGTGLGLTITKLVAQGHGGDVEAENLPESGVKFVFWVPTGV